MFNKNYIFSLKFYFFSIFLLFFQTQTFAFVNHNFTLFNLKLGSNISTIPNLKFIDECKKGQFHLRDVCANKIVYEANFSPTQKYDSINEYLVKFSPISKKIYHIEGTTKKFRTNNECYDFGRNVKKVVGERLVNENQKIIMQKTDSYSWFKLNQKFSGGSDLLTIDLKYTCWFDNPKKPLEASYGYLSLGFSNDYQNVFVQPEFADIMNQKQNQKDKKNTEKLRNF